MDFTPQVETREIADAELDAVAGGLVGQVANSALGTVDSVSPVSVSGTLDQVTKTAGVNTSGVTNLVNGL